MAARSTQSQTRPCCRNQLAGNCSWALLGQLLRIAALPLPVTTKWISIASRIFEHEGDGGLGHLLRIAAKEASVLRPRGR